MKGTFGLIHMAHTFIFIMDCWHAGKSHQNGTNAVYVSYHSGESWVYMLGRFCSSWGRRVSVHVCLCVLECVCVCVHAADFAYELRAFMCVMQLVCVVCFNEFVHIVSVYLWILCTLCVCVSCVLERFSILCVCICGFCVDCVCVSVSYSSPTHISYTVQTNRQA